jgi:hypothetical protein
VRRRGRKQGGKKKEKQEERVGARKRREQREGGNKYSPFTSRKELDDHVKAGFLPVLTPVDEVEHDHRLQQGEDGKEGVRKGDAPRTTGINHAAGDKGEEEEQGGEEEEGEAGGPTEGGEERDVTGGGRVFGEGEG